MAFVFPEDILLAFKLYQQRHWALYPMIHVVQKSFWLEPTTLTKFTKIEKE
ncbi:hypothetical protein F652_86 [Enterobacteriaceae bacterium bta3-1]|nr:hypothetical protein F652_86 [Enterobacteriaceae bacterium bta3-1]